MRISKTSFRRWGAIASAVILAIVVVSLTARRREPVPAPSRGTPDAPAARSTDERILEQLDTLPNARPVAVQEDGFVSSDACRTCHPDEHRSWHATYHRTMTQVAAPQSVLGRFDGSVATVDDVAVSFHRTGDEYWIRYADASDRASGATKAGRVVLTTGSHHVQAYWISTGEDAPLAMVPFVYLLADERWVPRRAAFLRPPGHPPNLEVGRWNVGCIRCHTTHGVPGVEPGTSTARSRVAEFGIACEACHGPGAEHVRHQELGLATEDPDRPIVNPAELPHDRSAHVCGQCHGKYGSDEALHEEILAHGLPYLPGDDLLQVRSLKAVDAEHFWPDGMIRVAGREFNGLAASPCYERGELSCLSCHSLHRETSDPVELKHWADDLLRDGARATNRSCLQCHDEFENASRLTAHTHHAAESSGSSCYNCHMPHTTYGLLKAIRSHQIDSPDLKVSEAAGRPNACNLCHLDRTLEWTATHLENWYGVAPPELDEDERRLSAAARWALTGDAGVRALTAWHMGWEPAREASGEDWLPPYLGQLLLDPYDAVRCVADRSLRRLPGYEDFEYDYVGPPRGRAEDAAECFARWRRRSHRRGSGNPAVLLDSDGTLLEQEWSRLLQNRSNRPVLLAE